MERGELTEKIIGCAMTVHRALGPGFLESVYQNALAYELRKADLEVEAESRVLACRPGAAIQGSHYL